MYVFDAWYRYSEVRFWWIHAMTLVWILFTLILFVLEPLILRRWFHEHAEKDPEKTFALVYRFHMVMLLISLATVAGAVAGSHGSFWI